MSNPLDDDISALLEQTSDLDASLLEEFSSPATPATPSADLKRNNTTIGKKRPSPNATVPTIPTMPTGLGNNLGNMFPLLNYPFMMPMGFPPGQFPQLSQLPQMPQLSQMQQMGQLPAATAAAFANLGIPRGTVASATTQDSLSHINSITAAIKKNPLLQIPQMPMRAPTMGAFAPPHPKNLTDVTAKAQAKSNWPKYYGDLPAELVLTMNHQAFWAIQNAPENDENIEEPDKIKAYIGQGPQIHVYSINNEYFGFLQHDHQFLAPLLREKTVQVTLSVKNPDEQSLMPNAKVPVSIRIYFPKKAFTVDPTLDEASSNMNEEESPEEAATSKSNLKLMFDKFDKLNKEVTSDDDFDDDDFALDMFGSSSSDSSKRRKTEANQDVSARKEENIEDWDDDDELSEYIDQSKEMEEESKKIHLDMQLDRIFSSITQKVEDGFEDDEEEVTTKKARYDKENSDIKVPDQLTVDLRPYQKAALKWMLTREQQGKSESENKEKLHPMYRERQLPDGTKFYYNTLNSVLTFKFIQAPPDPKGGILADEMGLGKTVEVISLVAANKSRHEHKLLTPTYNKQNKMRTKATLVVTPLTIVDQWKSEVENKTNPSMKVYVYQGGRRIKETSKLLPYDVIVTTYNTLSTEYSHILQGKKKIEECPLFSLCFHRIVLDEAHNIKNRKSLQARAATAVEAERRWAVTGTPIQNHIDDLFALFKFLRVNPHGDWRWWSKYIGKPFEKKDKKAIEALQRIVRELVIRRTKSKEINGEKIVQLPPKYVDIADLEFTPAESTFYKSLYVYFKGKFDEYVQTNTVMKNYANILEMLLHLRQACCHPALLIASYQRKTDKSTMKSFLQEFSRTAGHEVCDSILPMLPSILRDEEIDISNHLSVGKNWRGSTKVNALVDYLNEVKHSTKSVVFSQWTTMLDVVEIAMQRFNIKYVRLDGSMSRKERDTAVQTFKNDPHISVCLISLKVGGLGLNLVWATHVFLMDPWWNPAVEEQAIDRVHRIGQHKEVTVIRFIIRGSVEERIMKLQQTKTALANEALMEGPASGSGVGIGMTKKDQQKIREKDLRKLFDYEEEDEDEESVINKFTGDDDGISMSNNNEDDDDEAFLNSLE